MFPTSLLTAKAKFLILSLPLGAHQTILTVARGSFPLFLVMNLFERNVELLCFVLITNFSVFAL